MCTVTWLSSDDGYELFCSRDELRTRGPALAPRLHRGAGGSYLAPIDSDAGGSWVAVNDRGLALCLLNDYAAPRRAGEFESRGLLVTRLAAESTATDEAVERLAATRLGRYRPFRLVFLGAGAAPRIFHWDGLRGAVEEPDTPPLLTSSSYDPQAADASRRALLAAGGPRPGASELLAFHRSHQPARGPLSPCMHRADARTVSFTRLSVADGAATMSYQEGPPCRGAEPLVLTLPIAHVSAPAGA